MQFYALKILKQLIINSRKGGITSMVIPPFKIFDSSRAGIVKIISYYQTWLGQVQEWKRQQQSCF